LTVSTCVLRPGSIVVASAGWAIVSGRGWASAGAHRASSVTRTTSIRMSISF
jgi:hypothetical protein